MSFIVCQAEMIPCLMPVVLHHNCSVNRGVKPHAVHQVPAHALRVPIVPHLQAVHADIHLISRAE